MNVDHLHGAELLKDCTGGNPVRSLASAHAALTPLIWEHVNPYGRFDLDMNARLALL